MRNIDSHKFEYENLKAAKPLLQFFENRDFCLWKREVKEKLTELLGLPLGVCDHELSVEYEKQHGDFCEYRFTVQTEPGYFVPCHLLIPSLSKEKYPLTVCLSGHGSGMHIALGVVKNDEDKKILEEWPHRAMAQRSVKEGRAALVIEARNFGESSLNGYGTSCTQAAKIAILMGRTVVGERVWDAMRILDAVADAFPRIDMTDIVATGNSGGGTATYYLACMDERIRVAMPSCSVCSYEASIAAMSHCMCNHIPSSRKYFEMGDLAGLIAPRKLIIAAGELDKIFPIDGTKRTFELIKKIYNAAGVPDNCALVVGDKGHLNYADLLWAKFYEMEV